MASVSLNAATGNLPTTVSDGLSPNINVTFNIDDLTVLQLKMLLARLSKTNPRAVASACSHVFGIMQAHHLSPSGRPKKPRRKSRRQQQQRQQEGGNGGPLSPLLGAEADLEEDEVEADDGVVEGGDGIEYDENGHEIDPVVAAKEARLKRRRVKRDPSWPPTVRGNPRQRNPPEKIIQVPWETRFQQLVEYKAKHGHTRATKHNCKEDPRFGQWCANQRSFYRMLHEEGGNDNYRPKLTAERMAKLDSIGFNWPDISHLKGVKGEEQEQEEKEQEQEGGEEDRGYENDDGVGDGDGDELV